MIMKKNILAASVASALAVGFAGTASAVQIVEGGIGHALIAPYFSAQNGNATLINIVNTDSVYGKAVKVRFRGAVDSDDILDFQVFLSPNDVWTATVSQGSDGKALLKTTDVSCTLPAVPAAGTSFFTNRLSSYTDAAGTVHSVEEQTREGYIEIFNMADIPPRLANAAHVSVAWAAGDPYAPAGQTRGSLTRADYEAQANVASAVNPLYTAIKHVSNVAPCTAATLVGIEAAGGAVTVPAATGTGTGTALGVGSANYSSTQQIIAPTTGLMGNWSVINVADTRVFSQPMTALQATGQTMVVYSGQGQGLRRATNSEADRGNIANYSTGAAAVAVGQNIFPTLSLTEDAVLLSATLRSLYSVSHPVTVSDFDFPDLSTPYEIVAGRGLAPLGYLNAAAGLSTALSRNAVMNEFLTESGINGGTDWILSMPTRRYHVAGRSTTYGTAGLGYGNGATAPFAAVTTTYATDGKSSCQVMPLSVMAFWNREETQNAGTPVFSPNPAAFRLCGEVNILTFNNTDTAKSSTLRGTLTVQNIDTTTTAASNGWATFTPSAALPFLGASYSRAVNGTANFGTVFGHRYR